MQRNGYIYKQKQKQKEGKETEGRGGKKQHERKKIVKKWIKELNDLKRDQTWTTTETRGGLRGRKGGSSLALPSSVLPRTA